MHFNTNVRLGASLVAFLLAASSSTAAPQSSLATVAGTDKACLSQYCDKGPGGCADLCTKGACGPVDTKGLPCVAIPKGWYDPFTPGTNPNDNTLCGLTVEFTNPANGKTATAVITDKNEENPQQDCGVGSPKSFDASDPLWAALGGDGNKQLLDQVQFKINQ